MDENSEPVKPAKKPRISCTTFLIAMIMVVILAGVGLNEAVGYYYKNCANEQLIECFLHRTQETEPTGVTAVGTYSYKSYSVEMTLIFPLEGGAVSGNVTGDCEADIKGTIDGDTGIITGAMSGYCDPFFIKIPATASFSGKATKSSKTVPVTFTGHGGGIEHTGSLTLTQK